MTEKQLCVMTLEKCQKHMEAEMKALESNPDDTERMEAFRKTLNAYNSIEKKDEHTLVPVELCKSDPINEIIALTARLEELEKKIEQFSKDKDEKQKEVSDADEEDENKKKDPKKVEEDKDEEKPKVESKEESEKQDVIQWDEDMGNTTMTPEEQVRDAKLNKSKKATE